MPIPIGICFRFYTQMLIYIGTCFSFYAQMRVEKKPKAFAYRIYSHFTQQCMIYTPINKFEIDEIGALFGKKHV